MSIKVSLNSVMVKDQAIALHFYTEILGFVKKSDIGMGEYRWLTVVSPDDLDGAELVLEPNAHPAAKVFQNAMFADNIPLTSFEVSNINLEYKQLKLKGVNFLFAPKDVGTSVVAVFDDTCGNWIMLYELKE
jgi:predicted enzyme related to lactoylglutathione lyase